VCSRLSRIVADTAALMFVSCAGRLLGETCLGGKVKLDNVWWRGTVDGGSVSVRVKAIGIATGGSDPRSQL
jgi:hypothetical protein